MKRSLGDIALPPESNENLFLEELKKDPQKLDINVIVGLLHQCDLKLCVDGFGFTPLHLSAERGHFSACKVLLEEKCFTVDETNRFGFSPLHRAAAFGHEEIVKLLLQNGADVNKKTVYEDTPLHRACLGGHFDVIRALVKGGANINSKDVVGRTPLNYASKNGQNEIVEWMIETGARDYSSHNPCIEDSTKVDNTLFRIIEETTARVGMAKE